MTQDHTTAAPVCYRHPERSTLLSCSRCGRPICAECSIDATVGQRCPACVREEGVQRTIPTRTRRSRTTDAPASRGILALTILFFFLSGLGNPENPVFQALAQVNLAVEAGEWWRIFTPILIHGSITHILFNMWALWILGPQVERGVGTWPFIGLYLASAGIGGVAVYYMSDPLVIGVGASGAIFGLFGVWLSWALHKRNTAWGRSLLGQLGFLLLINAAIPFFLPQIAWQAHLGGLIAGFVIGEVWTRIKSPDASRRRTAVAFAFAVLAAILVMI